jgi:hypothetical protein
MMIHTQARTLIFNISKNTQSLKFPLDLSGQEPGPAIRRKSQML